MSNRDYKEQFGEGAPEIRKDQPSAEEFKAVLDQVAGVAPEDIETIVVGIYLKNHPDEVLMAVMGDITDMLDLLQSMGRKIADIRVDALELDRMDEGTEH